MWLIMMIGFFAFFSPVQATGGAWQTIGGEHYSSSTVATTPIVVDARGVPYIAYQDGSNGNKATVMKYSGSSWTVVGDAGFSPGQAGGLSLALDALGAPHVAFANGASSSRAMVMKYDGADWITVGNADFSTTSISGTKIVFNTASNTPYVAFTDGNYHITIMRLNSSTWENVGSPYTAALGAVPILAFDSAQTPYVAFSNISTGNPTIISFDGSSWNLVGSPITSMNLAANVSFAISASGTLYVGAIDISDYYLKTFTFNGSDWVQFARTGTVVTNGDTVMAFSPSGTPYIAFEHSNTRGEVISYNGSDWETVGEAQFSTAALSMMSLAFSSSGTPYVAYSDYDNNHVVVMAFLRTVPGQVTGFSAVGSAPSAAALSWTAPVNDGGYIITGYRIERESPIGNGFSTIATSSASSTSYTDTDLAPRTVYNYRVAAINSLGAGVVSSARDATTYDPGGGGIVAVPAAFIPTPALVLQPNPIIALPLSTPMIFSQPVVAAPPFNAAMASTRIPTSSAYIFKRVLKPGSEGADVKALQIFLNSHGFLVARSGPGSPGNETSLYGKFTAAAVIKFQEAHAGEILAPLGLTRGTGIFADATMKVVNREN